MERYFFDDLTVDPVTNLADESNLKVPIQGEPFGMKFTNIKPGDVSIIETSQARFEFDGINGDKNLIRVFKRQPNGLIPLTTLTLPINTLQGHTIETDVPGVVIVRSNGFTWSVGADSSILARSLTANSVHIGALENASDNRYSIFQAGIAFEIS